MTISECVFRASHCFNAILTVNRNIDSVGVYVLFSLGGVVRTNSTLVQYVNHQLFVSSINFNIFLMMFHLVRFQELGPEVF